MARLFERPMVLIVLLLIVLLLFGAKRLPGLASGIGQSLRIFKREVRDLADDDDAPSTMSSTPAPAPAPPAPPAPAPAVTVEPTEQRPAEPRA